MPVFIREIFNFLLKIKVIFPLLDSYSPRYKEMVLSYKSQSM